MIYADNAATTAMSPAAVRDMLTFTAGAYGNPSSIHSAGRAARSAIEYTRDKFARRINAAPEEIIFTSGGSEANAGDFLRGGGKRKAGNDFNPD